MQQLNWILDAQCTLIIVIIPNKWCGLNSMKAISQPMHFDKLRCVLFVSEQFSLQLKAFHNTLFSIVSTNSKYQIATFIHHRWMAEKKTVGGQNEYYYKFHTLDFHSYYKLDLFILISRKIMYMFLGNAFILLPLGHIR